MNKRQFSIILVVFVVIGGIGLYRYQQNKTSWGSTGAAIGQSVLGDFQVNDVARLVIKQASAELRLAKKGDTWVVAERKDYPANFESISEFILKLHDLKAVQSMDVGPSQRGRLEVEEPGKGTKTGTLIEFQDASGKPIRHFILGKSHMKNGGGESPMGGGGWPEGRYILPSETADHVVVVTDPLSTAEPKPEQWLSKDFFKIEKPSSIELISTVATNSWKLTRDTDAGDWKLSDATAEEKLDAGKVGGFSGALASPYFADLATNSVEASSNLAAGLRLNFQTFDHFTYGLTVSTNAGDDYLLSVKVDADLPKERTPGKDEKPEDKAKLDKEFAEKLKQWNEKLKREKFLESWTYKVSKWTFDTLLKERSQLLVEKKSDKKEDAKADAAGNTPAEPAPAK